VVVELPVFLWMYLSSLPDMELSRTRMFFMFVLVELAIAINFRSMRYSILKSPPHKWLVLALVWEIVLLVILVQFPAVRESFGIGLPAWTDMAEIGGFGLLVLVAMETAKYILRRTVRPSVRGVE
jgi:Ca2+-transporting ATPase